MYIKSVQIEVKMKQSQEINELAKALAQAQSAMEGAKKDAKNPFFNSSYATLSSVWDSCREQLTKNGLSVIQVTEVQNEKLYLITTLAHLSGQWVQGIYPVDPVKKDPQGYGSALSYSRRYALMAMVGLSQEDDDGNVATRPQMPQNQRPVNHAPQTKSESLSQILAKSERFVEELNQKQAEEKVEEIIDKKPTLSTKQINLLKMTCKEKGFPWGAVRGYAKHKFELDDPLNMNTTQFNQFLHDSNNGLKYETPQ